MKVLITLLILLLTISLSAYDFFYYDFSDEVFPPVNWTIDEHEFNWDIVDSENSGGNEPEIEFGWTPQFNGTSRLISEPADISNYENINLDFKHSVDNYGANYTLSVASRSNYGEWHTIWQINPTSDIPGETISVNIDNEDLGSENFQLCWAYTGDSYNINYWYLDDLFLYSIDQYDVMVESINLEDQYAPDDTISIRADVMNEGLNEATFEIICEVYASGSLVYSDIHEAITLQSGQDQTVTFSPYILDTANELYEVIVQTDLANDLDPIDDIMTRYINTYIIERKNVVVEIGTGTWSGYAPGVELAGLDLIANEHDVAVISYHNADDFDNGFSDARVEYYEIITFPTTIFDGLERYVGGHHTESLYEQFLPYYNERKEIKTAYEVDISGYYELTQYHFSISCRKIAPTLDDNIVLQMVLTESEIDYVWQDLEQVNFVERRMLPDAYGSLVDFSLTDSIIIEDSLSNSPLYIEENCDMIAFLQNNDTKEILQADIVALSDLPVVDVDENNVQDLTENSLNGNFPNPFQNKTNISFQIKKGERAELTIFNIKGQKIRNYYPTEDKTIIWDGCDENGTPVANGIYFYKLKSNNFEETKKMIKLN